MDPDGNPYENNDLLQRDENFGSYLIFKLDERLFKFRGQFIPAG